MASLPILVINSGSSSIKFSVYDRQSVEPGLFLEGAVDGIGTANSRFHAKDVSGRSIMDRRQAVPNRDAAFNLIASSLKERPFPYPGAIGHRMVGGGPHLTDHQRLTPELLAEMEKYISFAPLHAPIALSIMHKSSELFPGVPNFVCFDAVFHRTIPEYAARFAIPESYWSEGVRRYGAHGLSYESILYQMQRDDSVLPERLIVAHLGNGCSVTAIKQGKSIDTSMGLTPTGGLISATRTGDLDPGVLLYMLRKFENQGVRDPSGQLEKLVDKESGLLGVSQLTSDMRDLRAAAKDGNRAASMALSQFTYVLRKFIGAFYVALEGLDTLVFTGGIGENDTATRQEVCSPLDCLGVLLEPQKNEAARPTGSERQTISCDGSNVRIEVMPAKEDLIIARHVSALLRAG